jgi:hypothetical protein
MTDKGGALAALESHYEAFRSKIADLPDEAYSETWLGRWNLSQVLAHMTGWFHEMAGAFARVSRGERPAPEGVDYSDSDTWNAKFEKDARPGREALEAFDAGYAAYHDAAKALAEDQYGIDPEKGRPKIGNRLLQGAGIGHFEEHQPDLEAWLNSRGG